MLADIQEAIQKYIDHRQKTFFKYFQIELIPSELPKKIFNEDEISLITDNISKVRLPYEYKACPYCSVYLSDDGCEGCPMNDVGNNCIEPKSTYNQIMDRKEYLKTRAEVRLIGELEEGVTELKKFIYFYNKKK